MCTDQRSDLNAARISPAKEFRLFPGGEVTALIEFVEVHEVGVGALGPAARYGDYLSWEPTHGRRNRDFAADLGFVGAVLPVQAGRGRRCVREPVKRDVVEHLIFREFALGFAVRVGPFRELLVKPAAKPTGESASE